MRGLSSETRLRLALCVGAFAVAFGLSAARIGHGAPDFYVFWTAARHAGTPYDPTIVAALEARLHLGGTWPFVYPPTFLLFVAPFALAPMTLAYALWTALSCALFTLAASHLVRPLWATAILVVAPPVFFSAALGQTSLIVGAAAIAAWLWRDSRPFLAGALLGAAACVKPQAMLLAPIVFWGRWRMLGAMLAASAALALASVLAFGAERWLEWAKAAQAFRAIAPAAQRANPSALLPGPWWTAAVAIFGIALALASRDLAGLIGGAFCLTPYAHAYDLAPLAPLAAAWLFDAKRYGWGRAGAGGALLAGVVATPAAALAFFVALGLLSVSWLSRGGDRRRALAGAAPA